MGYDKVIYLAAYPGVMNHTGIVMNKTGAVVYCRPIVDPTIALQPVHS